MSSASDQELSDDSDRGASSATTSTGGRGGAGTNSPTPRARARSSVGGSEGANSKSVGALTFALGAHAAAEGVALGAAYARSLRTGRAALLSILAHNLPEGLATATVLRGRGKPALLCVFIAFAAAAPQAASAPLAFAFSTNIGSLSHAFVGFASATMLWIALTELLPDALFACKTQFHTEKVAAVASLSALVIAVACAAL